MKKYILKRVLTSLATLIVILLVLFILMDLMPGTPFNDEKLTEAQKALLYAKYGLDKPVFTRFFLYAKNMLKGDLGVSYAINKNFAVSEMVKDRLGISIGVGAMAMLLGTILGLILGILAALNHNTWIDNLCSAISVIGVSVPSYVFALLLCYYIAYRFGWLPILYNTEQPFISLILPAIALSVSPTANIARFTRSEMLDVLNSDYILLVQSKGVKNWKMIISHVLRNTLIPVITVMGPILVNLLTGSSVIEKIFGIPGIGRLMITAIQENDYTVTIACAFVYSVMYIVTMLFVDILYGIIDPRIRIAKEGE
ncbi:MAG: ABC transporter permease [Erysipelotrichaceae bacterium]|nr:ABC transporter permease [Erysipelotrichaceae bacterium]